MTLNGSALTQYPNKAAFDAATSGWYNAGGNQVVAKSASLSVGSAKTFAFTLGQAVVSKTFSCANGTTTSGQSVYVVGSAPQLGAWSVANAVKLSPTAYPTWTGTISNLPPSTDQWGPDPNISFTTPATGNGGTTNGGS